MNGFHIPVGNTHVFVPTAHVMADLAVADMVLAWVDANMDLPVGNAVYLVDALMGELSDEVGDLEIQVREPGRSEPKVALADTMTGERAGFVARQSFFGGRPGDCERGSRFGVWGSVCGGWRCRTGEVCAAVDSVVACASRVVAARVGSPSHKEGQNALETTE